MVSSWSFRYVGKLVPVDPGLLVVDAFEALRHDFPAKGASTAIRAIWDASFCGYEVTLIEVYASALGDGRGLTSETLRRIPVQSLLRDAISQLASSDAADGRAQYRGVIPVESGVDVLHGVEDEMPPVSATEMLGLEVNDVARLREAGPTTETLQWVARVYRVGQIWEEPPAKTVREAFGLPASTATYWIKQARGRGILMDRDG